MKQYESSNVNFETFLTWSPSFVKILDGLIPKLICLSCKPNSEFHVQNWSFDKKKFKFGAWMHNFNFACWIMKNHVSIQNEFTFMIFDDKCTCKSNGFVGLMESSMKKKLRVWWNVFWVEVKSGEVNENLSYETYKCFSIDFFFFRMKTCLNWC